MRMHRNKGLALLFVTASLAGTPAAQQSAAPASNVPALPADIPGNAKRWSVLTMGALELLATGLRVTFGKDAL